VGLRADRMCGTHRRPPTAVIRHHDAKAASAYACAAVDVHPLIEMTRRTWRLPRVYVRYLRPSLQHRSSRDISIAVESVRTVVRDAFVVPLRHDTVGHWPGHQRAAERWLEVFSKVRHPSFRQCFAGGGNLRVRSVTGGTGTNATRSME
jgi:hypothetical protein